MDRILSVLFPPRLPRRAEPQTFPAVSDPMLDPLNNMEHGIGEVRQKPYRDGIERFFAEEKS